MNKKFDGLNKRVKELKLDNKQLKRQNECLSKQVTSLTSTVSGLESRIIATEKKNEQLESKSRRDNLKFFGLSEGMNESWEQSETKIRNYISSELGMTIPISKLSEHIDFPAGHDLVLSLLNFHTSRAKIWCKKHFVRNVRYDLMGPTGYIRPRLMKPTKMLWKIYR